MLEVYQAGFWYQKFKSKFDVTNVHSFSGVGPRQGSIFPLIRACRYTINDSRSSFRIASVISVFNLDKGRLVASNDKGLKTIHRVMGILEWLIGALLHGCHIVVNTLLSTLPLLLNGFTVDLLHSMQPISSVYIFCLILYDTIISSSPAGCGWVNAFQLTRVTTLTFYLFCIELRTIQKLVTPWYVCKPLVGLMNWHGVTRRLGEHVKFLSGRMKYWLYGLIVDHKRR